MFQQLNLPAATRTGTSTSSAVLCCDLPTKSKPNEVTHRGVWTWICLLTITSGLVEINPRDVKMSWPPVAIG